MKHFILFFITLFTLTLSAQETYKFTTVTDLETTPVISQGITGTCWSFSSISFLESEIIRLTGKNIDLSEMYQVRNTYPLKAENFIMRQGKAQFGEGGLAHDVMNSVARNGLVPEEAFSGLFAGETKYNHAEMVAVLEAMLKTYVDNPGRSLSPKWRAAIEGVLDVYIGKNVNNFTFEGKQYTPESFLKMTKIVPEDYINITSFTHAPFYSKFILNIPDNWSNGSFYNVPLDEMMATIDNALENGFTVELDCDVSERSFSSKEGVAVIPENAENTMKALNRIYPEKEITQQYRQEEFENYNTTDDHLMHITGMLRDQNGTKYYKVKNSWGTDETRVANGGYVYFSEAYMRLKAISVTVHKDAVTKGTAKKLSL
ncbi:C1 family peptidase [Aequorivita sp. F47161]|uniref:Aminopeptidase n=1 Tax=Aequorivita vitellina TaxID=2874475 RepID=A0A9X1QVZ0_9FLAO|nr:C1 family peptidase [Aequorivita vitellina]MCG2418377.1 C1 family peptidase [Aequorivita vitellina]MCZ4319350.1 C1 family peptidase [Aequorivita viscosa]